MTIKQLMTGNAGNLLIPGQEIELGAQLSPVTVAPIAEECEAAGGLETDASAVYWVAVSSGESIYRDSDGSGQSVDRDISTPMYVALCRIFDYVAPDSIVLWELKINTTTFGPYSPDQGVGTGFGGLHFGHDYAVYAGKDPIFTVGDVHTLTPTVDGVGLSPVTLTLISGGGG